LFSPLLGSEISYADFALYHVLDTSSTADATCLADYEELKAFKARIESNENVAKYLASRPKMSEVGAGWVAAQSK
jgi:glutathione S-transferase